MANAECRVRNGKSVITDNDVRYFGAELDAHSLIPGEDAQKGSIEFMEWVESHRS